MAMRSSGYVHRGFVTKDREEMANGSPDPLQADAHLRDSRRLEFG